MPPSPAASPLVVCDSLHPFSNDSVKNRCRLRRRSTIGQLAAIGRRMEVANIMGINFSGFIAWWLWRTIYLGQLPRCERSSASP
jgi:NADH dehydrogenase FAD-containing subunit